MLGWAGAKCCKQATRDQAELVNVRTGVKSALSTSSAEVHTRRRALMPREQAADANQTSSPALRLTLTASSHLQTTACLARSFI